MSKRRFVLIAAVSDYGNKDMARLPGVRRDADRLRSTLKNHADGGVYRILWLPDGKATKQGMLEQLQGIAQESGASDQVIIYFGGHGWRERDARAQRWKYYLLPYDATFGSATSSGLSTEELGSVLNRVSAEELILILDCCHSGGIAGFHWTNDILDELFEGWRSYYVMAATRGREEAGEDDSGGFFMGALCAALEGAGIVPDKDGRISAQKAWSHAADVANADASRRGHYQTAVSAGISSPIYVTRPVHGKTLLFAGRKLGRGLLFLLGSVLLIIIALLSGGVVEHLSNPDGQIEASRKKMHDLWSGRWEQSYRGNDGHVYGGSLQLNIKDDGTVLGTTISERRNGIFSGKLSGSLTTDGRRLEGKWFNEFGERGRFVFTLSADDSSFEGMYSENEQEPKSINLWRGRKAAIQDQALPPDLSVKAPAIQSDDNTPVERSHVPAGTIVPVVPTYYRSAFRLLNEPEPWPSRREPTVLEGILYVDAVVSQLNQVFFVDLRVANKSDEPQTFSSARILAKKIEQYPLEPDKGHYYRLAVSEVYDIDMSELRRPLQVITEPLSQVIAPKSADRFVLRLHARPPLSGRGVRLVFDVAVSTSAGTILLEEQSAAFSGDSPFRLVPGAYFNELNALAGR